MMKFRTTGAWLAAALLLCPVAANATDAAAALPVLHADPARTSVSGLSSGAFMAVQYDVAFSASVMGVGVVAGGPYNCAYVNLGGIATCMQGSPSGAASYNGAAGFAALGQIDPVSNLAKGKVYIFSGTQDNVVATSVVNGVRDFYTQAQVPAANLLYVNTVAAGHAFVSADFGNACPTNATPYVVDQCTANNAVYDQPNAILTQIYGPLQPEAKTLSSQPVAFNQSEFGAASATGMASTGYVYIPQTCQAGGGSNCAVHVVFHGCMQGAKEVGNDVYAKVGYNQWADTNNIIVLYPQLDPTNIPSNPGGCWDWWGYTGLNFQVQSGAQLSSVRSMVKRLTTGQ